MIGFSVTTLREHEFKLKKGCTLKELTKNLLKERGSEEKESSTLQLKKTVLSNLYWPPILMSRVLMSDAKAHFQMNVLFTYNCLYNFHSRVFHLLMCFTL